MIAHRSSKGVVNLQLYKAGRYKLGRGRSTKLTLLAIVDR